MDFEIEQEHVQVVQQGLKILIKADITPNTPMTATWYQSIPVIAHAEVSPTGEMRVKDVTIYAPVRDEGHGVTLGVLREVAADFNELLYEAMKQAGVVQEGEAAERAFYRRRGEQDPVVRREMTGDHLGRVAAIYQEAEVKGASGLRAVMASFPGRGKTGRASKTTAARWIGQARDAGLLPSKERQND